MCASFNLQMVFCVRNFLVKLGAQVLYKHTWGGNIQRGFGVLANIEASNEC